jgi:hypothetical protein
MSCTDELSAVQHSAPPVVPAREQVKKRQQFLHASVRSHAACLRRFRASPPILRQSALCPRLWASAEAQVSLSPPRISSSPHTLPDESRSASSPRSDKLWGVVRISPRVAAIEEPRGQSAVARARRCRCPACSRISPPTTRSRPFASCVAASLHELRIPCRQKCPGPVLFPTPLRGGAAARCHHPCSSCRIFLADPRAPPLHWSPKPVPGGAASPRAGFRL